MQGIKTLIKAIDSVGDPPLPIPNREVKPDSADGTAKICGRVGHRHFYLEALNESLGLLFLLSHLAKVVLVIHYIAGMTCIAYNYSTKLLPLVAKHSSKLGVSLAYPQHCGRVGHRHFYENENFKQLRFSFFCRIPAVNPGSADIPAHLQKLWG